MANGSSPFSGQEYSISYFSFDDNLNTELESFDVDLTDGGEDVKTLMRGYAGRVPGAAMCSGNFAGVLPYAPTDTGGVGTQSGGMVTGNGVTLPETMLTAFNANNNLPVKFIMQLGSPAVQQLVFKGNITSLKFGSAVGKATTFSGTLSGCFNIFK
jgi:hypothetical protein